MSNFAINCYNKIVKSNSYIENAELIRINKFHDSTKLIKLFSLGYTPFLILKLLINKNKLIFPQLSFFVTNKCNLNCKYCQAYMEYSNLDNVNNASLMSDLDIVFETMDYVYNFIFTGGEPFLNRNLGELIEFIFENHKNKFSTLSIPTNGTVIPDKNTLLVLKKYTKNINIKISNYGEKSEKVIDTFNKYGISCNLGNYNSEWFNIGEPVPKNRSIPELKRLYKKCPDNRRCNVILNSEFHLCVPSACGMNFGLIEKDTQFYHRLRGGGKYLC